MNDKKVRPSRLYYLLAVVIPVITFVYVMVQNIDYYKNSFAPTFDNYIQVVGPGEREVQLDQPGNYTIFYEFRRVW